MTVKGNILIVDDTPASLKLLTKILKAEGFEVRSAISGEMALHAATSHPPELVLLDIRMPEMDGYEVLRRLKASPETCDVPVIFVSAAAEMDEKAKGFELGAVDYVTKPYQHAELLARVRTHLELARTHNYLANVLEDRKKIEAQVVEQYEYVVGLNAQLEATNKQLKQAQNQLLQAEKMAAIGLLAAGVAHEINNPIAYVNSNLGTLEQYMNDILVVLKKYEAVETLLGSDNPQLEDLHQIKKQIDLNYISRDIKSLIAESHQGLDRVKKIVLDLKDFSRSGDEEQWVWADVQQLIDSTLNIVWNELKYKCEVIKEYGVLPKIYCLPSQLNQVVVNLLVNAAQAIEVRGTITIRTGCEKDSIWFEVIDTGEGIPPESIPLLFDPFFTTRVRLPIKQFDVSNIV